MATTFFTRNNTDATELWAADEPVPGTERRLAAIDSDGFDASVIPPHFLSVGDLVYFEGVDAVNGRALWVSDGTPAGTHPVVDHIRTNSASILFAVALDGLLYFASDDRLQLWKTDGTAAGTTLVKQFPDIVVNPATIGGLAVLNDQLFFVSGEDLWTSDGTEAGTVLAAETENLSNTITVVGDQLIFTSFEGGPLRYWASDGTQAGTVPLSGSPADYFNPVALAIVGNTFFFAADDADHGRELWRVDIANQNAVLVKDLVPGTASSSIGVSFALGDTLYFNFSGALWKSDGADAGTVQAVDAATWPDFRDGTTVVGDKVLLFNNRGTAGYELWRSDGTQAGTFKVADLPLVDGAFVRHGIKVVGDVMYFEGNSGGGIDLWRTDGTAAGTYKVSDVEPDWEVRAGGPFAAAGGKLFFGGDLKAGDDTYEPSLFVSDGTQAGTDPLGVVIDTFNGADPQFTEFNGKLFFVGRNADFSLDLWKSDGTDAGTVRVKDINPIVNNGFDALQFRPGGLTVFDDALYFIQSATTAPRQDRLWRSDGTDAGTVQVDLGTYAAGGPRTPLELFAAGDNLFFMDSIDFSGAVALYVTDGISGSTLVYDGPVNGGEKGVGNSLFFRSSDATHGGELWVSDGTAAGTHMVKDIRPGSLSAFTAIPAGQEAALGNRLFFIANDGVTGDELWVSDGTEAGTTLVKDVVPGANDPGNGFLTPFNGMLLYAASGPGSGRELWRSDGTDAGTVMVKEIRPGTDASSPDHFTVVGDTLYFVANDGTHGREIWRTDGTETGTVRVTDLAGTPEGVFAAGVPQNLTAVGDELYFTISNQLMRLAPDPTGAELVAGAYAHTGTGFIEGNDAVTLAARPQGSDFHANANDDYSPQGSDEVLFQHTTDGQLYFASMNNGAFEGWGVASAPLGNQIVGGWADANRDGYDDIFVQAADGSIAIATQNDSGAPVWTAVPTGLASAWKLVGAADFSRDGYADAILQNQADGSIQLANIAAGGFQGLAVAYDDELTAQWHVVGTGDINADGFVDIVIQEDSTGTTYYANMANGTFGGWGVVASAVTSNWIVQGVADVTGDGHADVIFQNLVGAPGVPAGTTYFADLRTGSVVWGVVTDGVTADWVAKGAADVDDDGFAEVIFQNLVGRPPNGGDPGIVPGTVYYAQVNGIAAGIPSWGEVNTGAGPEWHAM